MAKGRSSNGGIGGSGIFGLFGTTIRCDSKDTSYYCSIMKIFNIIMILVVLYYLASFIMPRRFRF